MMKAFWFLTINIIFTAGFIYFIDSSLIYVFLGLAWLSVIGNISLYSSTILSKVIVSGGMKRAVPGVLSMGIDVLIGFVFLYSGYVVLAFFWFIQAMVYERASLLAEAARDMMPNLKEIK